MSERDTWHPPLSDDEVAKLERRLAFAVLFELVDTGDIEEAGAIAILESFDPKVVSIAPAGEGGDA